MSAAVEEDWSDLEDKVELRETNTMPRTPGTSRNMSSAGTRRTSTRLTKRLEILQKQLSGQMFQAGAMIGLGLPTTGYYIAQESNSFTEAIIALSRKRVEWIEALEHIADIAPGITIGRTVLGIGASLGVDRYHRTEGRSGFSPDKRACAFLGVTAAYYAVHKDEDASDQAGVYQQPPATFQPVS
jgi:hypothetical protein